MSKKNITGPELNYIIFKYLKESGTKPMDIAPNSSRLASGTSCSESSDVIFLEGHNSEVSVCAWSPTGSFLAYGAMEKEKPSPTNSDDGQNAENLLAEVATLEHRILTRFCYWSDGRTTTYTATRRKEHFNTAHRNFDQKCRRCGGRFKNKSTLQNHYVRRWPDIKKNKCSTLVVKRTIE